MDVAVDVTDAQSLIATFGLLGILAILFIETGLLVGFFLPGDSLLFLAGVGASSAAAGIFDQPGFRLALPALLIGAPLSAIVGAQVGHLLGARLGPKLFARERSRLFKPENVMRAQTYLARYGAGKAVVLMRFVPVMRTFLNPVAGALGMPARLFLLWNVVGGVVWTVGIIMTGYLLGDSIGHHIDTFLLPIIVLIIVGSMLPVLVGVIRARRQPRQVVR